MRNKSESGGKIQPLRGMITVQGFDNKKKKLRKQQQSTEEEQQQI
jgi:hypothetical protein